MQFGAVAVVLFVMTRHAFELDRFFVPKELVLHATALLAGILVVRRIDLLLAVFVLLGAVSVVFATNRWLGLRAMAIGASGVLLMMAARRLREVGLAPPLLRTLGFAVVLIAITSLIQAYGVDTDFFSENRAPGGTLGNRNFVAHAAAFGFPLVLLAAMRRKRWSIGVALVIATLVLTRSRAAWLAFLAVLFVLLVAMFFAPALRAQWRRLLLIFAVVAAGVGLALLLPNDLHWNSDNPYAESLQHVADYSEGSGHGRLVQYEHSLEVALRHPLFGVGPGNWPVAYLEGAHRNDPSRSDTDAGMTTNPWPSSDWIAFTAERGFCAVILLALAFLRLAINAWRGLRTESGVEAAMLLALLAGTAITGLLDAVLLLGLPTLLVFTALGALSESTALHAPRHVVLALLAISAIGIWRSASQWTAMEIYATTSNRASLENASRIDPGNYRLQLRLARMGGRNRCEHARTAHALFPLATEAANLARRCK